VVSDARYDAIADWYREWVGDGIGLIAEGADGLVPAAVKGQRVLDVACGHGRAARGLARLGAHVQGVDISERLIDQARAQEQAEQLGIAYSVADICDTTDWWDGVAFDGAVCEMAMMDIDDLAGTVRAVASTLRHQGWFAVSLVHPCFPGNDEGLSSWPEHGSYFDEGRWTSARHNPDGVRLRVGSTHRTLSTYLNTTISAGFTLERVIEPRAPVPTLLLLGFRRTVATH
jgi:2-polyprenyl-3-methyl-5-hydroxy-6-metoxy-1,4-benzoquinol methylase